MYVDTAGVYNAVIQSVEWDFMVDTLTPLRLTPDKCFCFKESCLVVGCCLADVCGTCLREKIRDLCIHCSSEDAASLEFLMETCTKMNASPHGRRAHNFGASSTHT